MKKCKHCKEPFQPYNSLHKYCFKDECRKVWIETEKANQWKKTKKEMSIDVYSKEHKITIQNEINKLARMIDAHCGYVTCIDCGKTLIDIEQIDGSHFHNVQGNENIRFNLNNIHSARSECNKHHGGRKDGYKLGLSERYGIDYLSYLENDLRLDYKQMNFSNKEIHDAIPVVRKLQRNLKTFINKNSLNIRNQFNKVIGLYIL